MSARPTTPASPKNVRVKSPVPGLPMFGCEHIQLLLSKNQEVMNSSITHYKLILRGIFDATPIVPQTSTLDGRPVTSLTSNYLCLQCPSTVTEEERLKHGTKKQHRFYVDSRSGCLYCQICDDYIWDPTLEELRVRKIGTGSFSAIPTRILLLTMAGYTGRKRKHDELFTGSFKDDPRFISNNTNTASCRANGLRGIYNAGATCYQNVVLQSFLHNPLLRNFYLSDGHQSSDCQVPHCLSCAMDDMFQDFYALETTNGYTAANILSGFWISEKKAFENLVTTKEQDAHEFFQFLAEELHERNGDGKKPEIGSEHSCNCIMHQTFYGLENVVQKKSKRTGQKKPTVTLQDCLDEEYINIKRLPNVLSIQLKRFEYRHGRHDRAASKVDNEVKFPLQLNMMPYTNRVRNHDSRESLELERSCTYDLLSVVVHVGELDTGHYTSYCRVGDQWFKFNDHKVELASLSDVLGAQAYLLFYIIRSLA
ncbi:ubiquitin carboxyl-terminal hydrolase 22 27 51 [Fusarium longipes]|uniref:Ubiquitin carboxyl-terminal hydrolase 22 27 51 n=1 Tax=Fusarium longipes TaxID=694270 RepID=A0A395SHC0_9HYPO|nr:ubiquitin carboxyl-terminal hydrolase 22 27 51 [Fusarium longipes]